jgi:hypothetical protein
LKAALLTTRANIFCATSVASDLRETVRYALHSPAVFRWLDDGGVAHEAHGWTRDINLRGVYVFASDCPPLGVSLTMRIELPALWPDSGLIQLKVKGRVLRVDLGRGVGRCSGFSVQTERVRLCAN